jgi:hypothetical protein
MEAAGFGVRCCRRTGVAQARAVPGERQLQGPRHDEPAALPSDSRERRDRCLRWQCRNRDGRSRPCARRQVRSVFADPLEHRQAGEAARARGAAYSDALQACLARQQQTGALLAHAYDQPEVVAGAGTLALEIEAQGGVPDSVLVSVGGGGLIAGIAAWFERRCDVVAVEPELAPTLFEARRAGQPSTSTSAESRRIRWARGASAPSPGK